MNIYTVAFLIVTAFILGLLVPRDIAPLRRFSAFLMRHHRSNRRTRG